MRAAGLAALAVLLGACVAPIPHPTTLDERRARERWPEASVESLEAGRRLYVFRCSGCHRLHAPRDRQPEDWPDTLDDMVREARVTPAERQLIEQFLVTAAQAPRQALAREQAPSASAQGPQ